MALTAILFELIKQKKVTFKSRTSRGRLREIVIETCSSDIYSLASCMPYLSNYKFLTKKLQTGKSMWQVPYFVSKEFKPINIVDIG